MMKRLFPILLAGLLISSMVVPLLSVHAQIPRDENSEPLEFLNSPTTGNINGTDWQRDTTFFGSEINVDNELMIDFEQQGYLWYGYTKANSTWVSVQQNSFMSGDYVYFECKNNDVEQIKCWLRGSVTGEYNFWIDIEGGIWNPNMFTYTTLHYTFDLRDVAEHGFPMVWDTVDSRLGIKVSGTFDIDPTITAQGDNMDKRTDDIQVTVGHYEYIFFDVDDSLRYMYKNASEVAWQNGTKTYAVNRTYATSYNRVSSGAQMYSFKSNGTHVYGVATSNGGCGSGAIIGCFFLFNVTQPGSVHNVTDGYNAGQLVLHTNATVPCLGDATSGGECGNWSQETQCGGAGNYCSIDVAMNSTGFPMIAYTTQRSLGSQGYLSPAIMISVAENPVGAECREKSDGSTRPCNANDARNGKNGTWTRAYQTDTIAEVITGGSGSRYVWSSDANDNSASHSFEVWEVSMCSVGSGNMFFAMHNTTAAVDDQGAVWGRFWYQSNATWGSQFPIFHNVDVGGRYLMQQDNVDITCTPNNSGVMTAHVAWTSYHYHSPINASGIVHYVNFTNANSLTLDETREGYYVAKFPHATWALDVQIVADNSTGTIGIFYPDNYGRYYFNFTGYYGTEGFSKTKGIIANNVLGLTEDAPDLTGVSDTNQYMTSTQMFINGTDATASVFLLTSEGGLTYHHWVNRTIPVQFHYYNQQGTPVSITNMTFTSNINGTELVTPSDCSTCDVRLHAGGYTVNAVYNGNDDVNINATDVTTTFYVDLGNRSASFIVGNVSITFTFVDEITLTEWDLVTKPVTADIWIDNEKVSYLINSNATRKQWLAKEPENINIRYQDTGGYNATRWESRPGSGGDAGTACTLSTGCNYQVKFYLSDYTTYNNYNYLFTLVDPTVTDFINGTFIVRKHTTNGLVELSEQQIPMEPVAKVTLIYGEEYVFEARTATGSKLTSLGSFIAGSDLTMTLFVDEISFAPEVLVHQKYIHWDAVHNRTAGTVEFWFQDANNRTTLTQYQIWNYSGIQFEGNSSVQEFSVLWTGASSNATHTYFIQVVVDHMDFGKIKESKPIRSYGSPANWINFGRCPSCSSDLFPSDSPWFVYVSGAATIFVAGLFSTSSAAAGTLIIAIWVAMLYQFGFFPGMESIIIVFIMLYAIISVFALRRGFRG